MSSNLLHTFNQLLKEYDIKMTYNNKLLFINKVLNLEIKPEDLIIDYQLDLEQIKIIENKLDLLRNNLPFEYILESVDFCDNHFFVDRRVLIPRVETEELVYQLLNLVKSNLNPNIKIADIGTGSGCIGISLKYHLDKIDFYNQLYLVDISNDCLDVATINCLKIIDQPYTLYQGNLLQPLIDKGIKVDLLVANLPYIDDDYILDESVLKEPHLALFGGQDGTNLYLELFEDISKVIKSNTIIGLEIGFDQKEKIIKIIQSKLPNKKIIVKKDLNGNDRLVFIMPKEYH